MGFYDDVLAQWPDSTESLCVDTRHGSTHVLAQGARNAPPLVLFHGAGSNALAWGADVPGLAKRYRVYAVDTPGEPGRSTHGRISWKGNGIVEWLGDLLDGLGVSREAPVGARDSRPILVGISQGGYIALRYATARPEEVRALVVLNPGGVSPPQLGFLLRAMGYGLMGSRGAEALVRCVMGDCEVHPVAITFSRLIYNNFRSRIDPQPLLTDDALAALTMPVLVLAGEKDPLFEGAKTTARFRRSVPSAEVRLVPGAGHALVGVAAEVIEFLESARKTR